MTQQTRDQHFIPQFHLKLFSDPTDPQVRVWAYDVRNTGRPPKPRVPAGICYEEHLYTLPRIDNLDPMEIEHSFKKLEDKVAKIVKPFQSRDPAYTRFSEQESALLRAYLGTLIVRNPRYLRLRQDTALPEVETKLKKQGEKIAASIPNPILGALFLRWVSELDLDKAFDSGLLGRNELSLWPHLLTHDGEMLMKALDTRSLAVFTLNEGERPYFLPDFPVIFWNSKPRDLRIATPLGPWSMLIVGSSDDTTLINDWNALGEGAWDMLALTAEKYCYSHENCVQLSLLITKLADKRKQMPAL